MDKDMASTLLAEIKRARGYVLPMHEVLAERHPEFLQAYDRLYGAVMHENSPLPRKVRELILIGVCIALGSDDRVIAAHIRRALENGASAEEVLAAIEVTALAFTSRSLSAGTRSLRSVLAEERSS